MFKELIEQIEHDEINNDIIKIMARSIDILTSDEKHLVVFAKGVTLDKSLPKYIRIKEKKESSSKEDTFNNWKSIFDNYLNEIISECTDIYLYKMGLKVRIDIDYNFGGKQSKNLAKVCFPKRPEDGAVIWEE